MVRRVIRPPARLAPRLGGHAAEPSDSSTVLRSSEARRAARRLMEFHSRGVRETFSFPLENLLGPCSFFALGEPAHVRYYSDKDDPETRNARQRRGLDADPAGVQGVWKHFIHRHDPGVGLRLYTTGTRLQRHLGARDVAPDFSDPSAVLDVREWPDTVYWLGEMTEVRFERPDGRVRLLKPETWMLWAFPDTRTLMALPHPVRGGDDVLLWHGGNLCVTYRGIQG